jgi:hypothetical protein
MHTYYVQSPRASDLGQGLPEGPGRGAGPARALRDRIGHESLDVVEDIGIGDGAVGLSAGARREAPRLGADHPHGPARGPTSFGPTSLKAASSPGRVFDRTIDLGPAVDGYRAMVDHEALKVLIRT